MALDMIMKLTDVSGESKIKSHEGEIDVLAWHWEMEQKGVSHVGGGNTSGKVNVQDLTFTKYVDKATCKLLQACCNGKHLKEAVLVVRKAGEKPVDYFKITMEDCVVAGVRSGHSDGQERLTEDISLNFAKVKVEYQEQESGGSGKPAGNMGWDIAGNTDYN